MLTRSDHTISGCSRCSTTSPARACPHRVQRRRREPRRAGRARPRIKAAGAISYMEVVSTTREACLRSAQVARDIASIGCSAGRRSRRCSRSSPAARFATCNSRSAVRASDQARRFPRPGRGRLPPVPSHGLRRRRPACLARPRPIRSTGPRGPARQRRHLAGRRQRPHGGTIRNLAAAGADAFTIGTRYSTARSRRI